MTKEALVLAADTHSNATWGLCPPKMELDDGQTVKLSKPQRWLWEVWIDALDWVKKLTKDCDKITGILNGDLGEIDAKNRSNQLITRNKADAQTIACDALEPFFDACNKVYVIRGTEAHNGKSCWFEESIAKNFDNIVPFSLDDEGKPKIATHYELQRKMGTGAKIDAEHHTMIPHKPWTEHAGAGNLAAFILNQYVMAKLIPPDLAIRAHCHVPGDSYDAFPVRALILPPMCLKSSFINRIGQGRHELKIGVWVVVCEDGNVTVEKYMQSPTKGVNVWLKQL